MFGRQKGIDVDQLKETLKVDEGVVYEIYNDHLGYPTFGIGHLVLEGDPEHGASVGTPVSEDRVDECQNLNFHELDTITTRVGQDSKIIYCGDFSQTDLLKQNEKNGLHDFLRILMEMQEFNCVEFNIGDIVRSGFVRNYLIQKTKLGMGME